MDFHQEHRGRYGNSNMSTYCSTSSKAQIVSARSHFYPMSSKHAPSKVKFMSSSGGKIFPRPSDMKLRYVGGQTRMISVHRGISYGEFYLKMTEIYGPHIVLKYQLPEEDLDALVSVSCDEDLENMMEECDKLNSGEGSLKLRVFVFQESEIDVLDLNELSDVKSTEQKYIDALNDTSWDLLSSRHNISFTQAETQSHASSRSYNPWNNGVQSQENGVHNKADKGLLTNDFHRDLLTFDYDFHPAPASVTSVGQYSNWDAYPGANVNMNGSGHNISANGSDDFCDLECGGSSILSQQLGHLNFSENDNDANIELQRRQVQHNNEIHATFGLEKNSQGDDLLIPNSSRTSQHSSELLVNSDGNTCLNEISAFAAEGLPASVIQERLQFDAQQTTDPFDLLHQESKITTQETKITIQDKDDQIQAKSAAVFPVSSSSSSVHDLDLGAAKNLDLLMKQEGGSISAVSSHSSISQASDTVKSTTKWQAGDQTLQVTTEDKGEAFMVSEPQYTSEAKCYSFFTPDEENQTEMVYSNVFQKPISQNGMVSFGTAGLNNTEHFLKVETSNDDTTISTGPVDGYTVQERDTAFDKISDDEKIWDHNDSMSQTTPIKSTPLASQAVDSTENDFLIKLIDTPPQEAIVKTDLESAMPQNNSLTLLSSVQQINSEEPSFHSIQSLLSSREQFDKTATTFASAFNNEAILRSGQHLQRNTQVGDLGPTKMSPLASVIETWEASLLQDDNGQILVPLQRNAHEVVQRIDEDAELEFEELDEFQSFDYGPRNVISAAEQEAIARGLQIIRNSDLEELRELGSGTFGTVYHGKWRGTDVAIKRIKASCFAGRQNDRERLMADFWKEACLLSTLHHPNVVAFYGIVPDGPGETLATVTEYMANGSLKQVLRSKERTLDRRKRLLIAMDAAFGMEYLHGKNVVHFDIKCENLLVNMRDIQRPICKVGDLGLSKVKQQTFVSGGVRGTLPWMAPELLNGGSSLVSEKVDVFSFGIVMWELLTGEEPYANLHYGAIIGGIVNNTLRPPIPRLCDPAWRSLMEKCWAADPAARPTFLEITRTLRAMEASLASKTPVQVANLL